jgi:hypothetical protein
MRRAMPDEQAKPTQRRPSRAWSAEDDAALRAGIAAKQQTPDIARALGRTVDAVRGRAQVLRLRLTPRLRPWRTHARGD